MLFPSLFSDSKTTQASLSMTTKPNKEEPMPTLFHRQIQKLYKLLSPRNDLKISLLLSTLPSLRGSGVDLDELASSNSRMEAILQNVEIHQHEFFMFHATLIQLQKMLEAVEAVEVRPLVERMMQHNMALIKLLFRYILQSSKEMNKRLQIDDMKEFEKHYRPLKEVFPFL